MKISSLSILILGIVSLFLLESCASSQKLVSKGKYSEAVEKAVKELQDDPYNLEEQKSLYDSFDFANRDDLNKIKSLRVKGDGKSLIEVFRLYEKLDERARSVSSLSSVITEDLNIYDFRNDMKVAADDACGKVMDEAFLMLGKNNPVESRKALTHLQQVERISPGYPGLQEMLYDAEVAATIAILFKIDDDSRIDMLEDLEDEIEDEFKDGKWNKYYMGYSNNPITYVFEVNLDKVSFNENEKSKEQILDSLRLTTIVKEISAELSVDYDLIDNQSGDFVERKDEEYNYKETHTRYEYEGKLDSLSSSLRKDIMDTKNKPFPNSYEIAENNKEEWIKEIIDEIKKIIKDFD